MVKGSANIQPFQRDKLLLSIHNALQHRKSATGDATALTETVLTKLYSNFNNGVIEVNQINNLTLETLRHFDQAAATYYKAFHP